MRLSKATAPTCAGAHATASGKQATTQTTQCSLLCHHLPQEVQTHQDKGPGLEQPKPQAATHQQVLLDKEPALPMPALEEAHQEELLAHALPLW